MPGATSNTKDVQIVSPISGSTVFVAYSHGDATLIIDPAGALALLNISMFTASYDSQEIVIIVTRSVVLVNFVGGNFVGAPTTFPQNAYVKFIWIQSKNAWYRTSALPTLTDIGLTSINNTSDLEKPISTATQSALDAKQPLDPDLTALAAISGQQGDMIIHNGTSWARLVKGLAGQKVRMNASATLPEWFTDSVGGTPVQYNQSVAQQTGFTSDTYLTGSSVLIPDNSLKIGSRYYFIFNVNKTNAGTATPIITIRFGTAGAIGDAARCTFTFSAQTAATDSGTFEGWITFRVVGGSAIMQGVCQRRHGASVTGLGTLVSEAQASTSAAFNSAVSGSIIGVSVNGGASAAWTVQLVQAKLENLV